jgi:hypothetical protein
MTGCTAVDGSGPFQRAGSKDAVKPRDPNGAASVGRFQLGVDSLKATVDGLGLDVERGCDELAAMTSLFMPQQFDVGGV